MGVQVPRWEALVVGMGTSIGVLLLGQWTSCSPSSCLVFAVVKLHCDPNQAFVSLHLRALSKSDPIPVLLLVPICSGCGPSSILQLGTWVKPVALCTGQTPAGLFLSLQGRGLPCNDAEIRTLHQHWCFLFLSLPTIPKQQVVRSSEPQSSSRDNVEGTNLACNLFVKP